MSDSRFLLISSPLGPGALVATRLAVTEQLGLPYSIDVEVLGSDPSLTAADLLTQEITVSITQTADGQLIERHFHGLVAAFERLGPGSDGRMVYRLEAVPGIWRLGLKRNCRVFQDKTVQAIVTAVLGEHDQPAPTWGILPALQPIVYCTQFNETDLHFISRLLEEHGMTYYFSHTASAHTLHVSATAPGFPAFVGGDVVAAHRTDDYFQLNDWRRANRARSASTQFEDMDGERSQPSVVLSKTSNTRTYADEPAMWQAGKVFRWPGGMSTRPGVDSAAVAMGEQESASEDFSASALDPRFAAGSRMSVAVRFEDGTENKEPYVVTAVRHMATDSSGVRSGTGGSETYAGALSLSVASRTWMPAPRHARPVMAGLYSAKVMGPSGEKIHVDEFGRIKIKFRWDRLGPDDDTASCWVRVMQAAGGAWGGTWFLPRVGDEVLVAFLDGDPDRPVVTGAVYGKDAKPPFLPGTNRAQSGFRSRSYKSESADDSNILRFEDKKGSEEVLVHAQKDLTVEVENDENRTIGHDSTETVQNARTATIKDSHDTLTVEKGNRTATIKMGNDTHTIKMGDMTVKCELGSITLEAMQKITLKVGQNTVVIDQAGITAKGIMISNEAQAMHKTKAPMVQVNADAMVQVQGGIVMLN
ncbi:type VI secretion system Vgr family protein [Aquabacterium sp.]|uniref:type VI secretion system Vgr family protein n=1 Tax=Aquabacterium sp. TaxID=1872578 RepID=UPI002C7C429E|nr:type VI secretion system tip protein TssI/VgrG [Aquabacterium sp.]HSW03533.1 type VI secretion system tip protein TssI/VgrG [Aquabacterium sp.]